jgi:16S rRNA (cytosine967-C5)-methyltransferase
MKRGSLLGHVVEILDQVRTSSQPADALVKEFFRERHYLGSTDRRYIGEMVFGILRNFSLVDAYVTTSLRLLHFDPLPSSTPSVGWTAAYAIRLKAESQEGFVSDFADLWSRSFPAVPLGGFLQALSSVTLPAIPEEEPAAQLATLYSTPRPIVEQWLGRFGRGETVELCTALNLQAPTTIRVNTLRTSVEECAAGLWSVGIGTSPTTLSPVGLTVEKRAPLESTQAFKDGWFEMQDEGSQLLSMLLQLREGMTVVDACAGAGGKSLHMAALMNNRGNVLALDVDQRRLRNLEVRVGRAGVSIIHTTLLEGDAEILAPLIGAADAVLVDAPCSGVGTYRRNPGLKLRFGLERVEKLARKQRSLLEFNARLVKKGGRLVYSTCTLLQQENEDVVASFLTAHADFCIESAPTILAESGVRLEVAAPYLLLLPHRTHTDGFFAAVLKRGV